MRKLQLLVAVAPVLLVANAAALAQEESTRVSFTQSRDSARTPIRFGVSTSALPGGAGAVIIRSPHRKEPDMVIVNHDADPATMLPAAFATVRSLRESSPNPEYREVHSITSVTPVGPQLSADAREALDMWLRLARVGRRATVAGIGEVRLITIAIR